MRRRTKQFGENQPRLNGLAKSDVVRDEHVHPRHPQCLQEWNELIVLNLYRTMEGAGDR